MKKYNGIEIGKLKKNFIIQNLFNDKYHYLILNLKKNTKYIIKNINRGSIAIINTTNSKSKFFINKKKLDIQKYKFFGFNQNFLEIQSSHKTLIAIAGVKMKILRKKIEKFEESEIYKVAKPWGYELWINGESEKYSFKKIFIKKGNRTSLQFHKKKIETNFLYKGSAQITLSKKNGKNEKEQILKNLYKMKINSGNYVNVNNYAIHRLKAISNITLYEVSTPHLDDVIRIADDKKRKNGRINSEHTKAN